ARARRQAGCGWRLRPCGNERSDRAGQGTAAGGGWPELWHIAAQPSPAILAHAQLREGRVDPVTSSGPARLPSAATGMLAFCVLEQTPPACASVGLPWVNVGDRRLRVEAAARRGSRMTGW